MVFRKIKHFLSLPSSVKSLFFELLLKATFVKLNLKLSSHKKVFDKIKSDNIPVHESDLDQGFISDLIWANRILGHNFKVFECYTKAISCKLLLRKRNIDSSIHIGFKKNDKEKLDGHAWLICGDQIVTGNSNIDSFQTAFII